MVIQDWSLTTGDALRDSGIRILNYLPNLFGALIIIIVGLILASIARWFVYRLVKATSIQSWFNQLSFSKSLKTASITTDLANMAAELVKWIIIIIFLIPSATELGLPQISSLLNDIIYYLPNVGVAIIILFFGVLVAEFMSGVVKATATGLGTRTAAALAVLTRYIVYIFAGLTSLSELGIASQVIVIFLYGFVGALSIAIGLAFGLGGKEAANDFIAHVRRDFSERKK